MVAVVRDMPCLDVGFHTLYELCWTRFEGSDCEAHPGDSVEIYPQTQFYAKHLNDGLSEVIVIGGIEQLFLGMAFGDGAPKATRKILNRRYVFGGNSLLEPDIDCKDCP